MVACGLRFILQNCHLRTTYDASHSSDFKLLCINWLNFPVIKQQLLVIVISPGSGGWLGSVGLFWLQRVAGWWWLGGQAADRVESTCKLFHSHAGAWARRIQTAVGWVHGSLSLSLSLHLSNTAAWGGQTSQTWLKASKLCALREHAEPDISTTTWSSVGSYEKGQPILREGD